MLKTAINVLMEAAPDMIDYETVYQQLKNLKGVSEIHDLHIWNISTQMVALSVHLVSNDTIQTKEILHEANELLQNQYDIYHTTIQIENFQNCLCDKNFECQKK